MLLHLVQSQLQALEQNSALFHGKASTLVPPPVSVALLDENTLDPSSLNSATSSFSIFL
jgi:hypothetical protein